MKPDPTVAVDWICCVQHSDVATGHVSSFHLMEVGKVVCFGTNVAPTPCEFSLFVVFGFYLLYFHLCLFIRKSRIFLPFYSFKPTFFFFFSFLYKRILNLWKKFIMLKMPKYVK